MTSETQERRPLFKPVRGVTLAGLIGALAFACGVALTATSGWLIVRASERPVVLTLLTAIVAVRAVFGYGSPLAGSQSPIRRCALSPSRSSEPMWRSTAQRPAGMVLATMPLPSSGSSRPVTTHRSMR